MPPSNLSVFISCQGATHEQTSQVRPVRYNSCVVGSLSLRPKPTPAQIASSITRGDAIRAGVSLGQGSRLYGGWRLTHWLKVSSLLEGATSSTGEHKIPLDHRATNTLLCASKCQTHADNKLCQWKRTL